MYVTYVAFNLKMTVFQMAFMSISLNSAKHCQMYLHEFFVASQHTGKNLSTNFSNSQREWQTKSQKDSSLFFTNIDSCFESGQKVSLKLAKY